MLAMTKQYTPLQYNPVAGSQRAHLNITFRSAVAPNYSSGSHWRFAKGRVVVGKKFGWQTDAGFVCSNLIYLIRAERVSQHRQVGSSLLFFFLLFYSALHWEKWGRLQNVWHTINWWRVAAERQLVAASLLFFLYFGISVWNYMQTKWMCGKW